MKIIQRRLLLLLAVLLALTFTGTAQAVLPEPVRQAILEAVNSNPEVQRRWHAFLASEQERAIARGGYYPEVDVRLSAGRQWQDSDRGRFDRDPVSAAVTLNQMLYDGFFTRSEVRRLGHARLVRYYELIEAAEQAALEALRAYMDVERHRELVALADDNYQAHRSIYRQVEELVQTGVGRGVDLDQAAGRLALAESNLVTEVANLHDVKARFLRVVGRMPSGDFVDLVGVLPADDLPATVHDANVEALASNPALFASVENILSAQEQVRTARSNFQPRLDFQVRQSRDNALTSLFDGNEESIYVNDTTVGVVLSMNLFRGFADQSRIGQFVEETNAARDQREIVCRNVRQEVTIAFNDVKALGERLVFLDQHQLSSDRVRTAYRQQFNIGQRTLLDLLDAENEFFVARRAFVDGQFDREISLARTFTGLGRLLPTLEIARDAMPDIEEVTTIDPTQVCPPVAPDVARVDRTPPPAVTQFTTSQRLSSETSFAFGSGTLTPEGREAVRGLAAQLTVPGAGYSTILVEGHTCSIGPADYNQGLSERRARSVADELIRQGVRPDAIRVVGYGMDRPIADNATEEGRQLNRRVEVSTDVRNVNG